MRDDFLQTVMATAPAFKTVGKEDGLEVWRIEVNITQCKQKCAIREEIWV